MAAMCNCDSVVMFQARATLRKVCVGCLCKSRQVRSARILVCDRCHLKVSTDMICSAAQVRSALLLDSESES